VSYADPDPDRHEKDADPHSDPSPNFTNVSKIITNT
jgi:hypothetical protein